MSLPKARMGSPRERESARHAASPPPEPRTRQGGVALWLKRLLDVLGAVVLLLVSVPVSLVGAAAIWLTMGRPVLFRQERSGWQGRPFVLLKFRTMANAWGPSGDLLPDEFRQTRVGNALRRLSIDELPQLWNVLRGEMSLVGNRPLPVGYWARMNEDEQARYETIPGIADLASLRGRYRLTWEEQFELDVWYSRNWSLWLDLRVAVGVVWLLACNRDQIGPGAFRQELRGGRDGPGGRT